MSDFAQGPDGMGSASAAPSAVAGSLHEAVLETLASAVISLEPGGLVTTFNAAAATITGIAPSAVIGRTFAEVFLAMDGAEAFAQAVLDAVYDDGPLVRQRVVDAAFPAGGRTLSMSVSHVRDAAGDTVGVAVVFDDISEVQELRAKELKLAREIEAQHHELKGAYLRLEEQNQNLGEAQKQTRLARVGGTSAGVILLAVLVLSAIDIRPQSTPEPTSARPSDMDDIPTFVVAPRTLTKVVTLAGQLAPRREVDVTSPMTGKIAAVHVPVGARVESGQPLLELDAAEVRIQHRDAQAAHIKALERFNETEAWSDSVEVSRARRSLTKARADLEDSRSKLEETAFLLEQGVIPTSEHEGAQRNFNNRQLDLEAAEQDLATVLDRGAADGRVARLELDNAKARLDELSEMLRLAVLRAPVAGVVMRPRGSSEGQQRSGGGGQPDRLASGDSVTQGQRLLIIGDLEGLSVIGRVDEVDVVRILPGSPASIRGDAFPGTVLRGRVDRVSSQADVSAGLTAPPSFEVATVVDRLTDAERAALRIGMSALLEVVVFEKPDALMVPIEAVTLEGGQPTLQIADGDDFRPVPVTVGETTVDAIEITGGVAAGDRIRAVGR